MQTVQARKTKPWRMSTAIEVRSRPLRQLALATYNGRDWGSIDFAQVIEEAGRNSSESCLVVQGCRANIINASFNSNAVFDLECRIDIQPLNEQPMNPLQTYFLKISRKPKLPRPLRVLLLSLSTKTPVQTLAIVVFIVIAIASFVKMFS